MKKHVFILFLLMAPLLVWSQTKDISGKVTDEFGEALPGAAVTVKGTQKGTLTDMDGAFTIKVSGNENTLVVSFFGYTTQDVDITGKTVVNASLHPDAIELEEVVAVGYGTQKKVNLIGAAENVNMKSLENRPLTNTSMALQGQIAGVDVIQGSGEPGADQGNIRIRGVSSIENNNDPLVIIDGQEGDINQVNPKDIESMSVLKDASSAAIYGNRAAAGVIIITTKSGSEGSMKVNYSANFGLQQATKLPDPVGIYTWIDLKQEMLTYNGQKSQADALEVEREKFLSGEKVATNYYDQYFETAFQQDHYINISGGNKQFRGSVSLGYTDQDGVLTGTSFKKYSFRTNIDAYSANRVVNFKFNLSGFRAIRDEYAVSSNTIINNVHRAGPISVFKAQNGLYGFYGLYTAQKDAGGGKDTYNNALNGRATLNLNLFKGFQLSGALGVYYGGNTVTAFQPPVKTATDLYGNTPQEQSSRLERTNVNSFNTTLELIARYNTTINKDHKLNALFGFSQMEYKYEQDFARRDNYTTFLPSLNLGDPATQVNSDSKSERTTRAYFGRFGYTYKDRYLFEANFRADATSRFRNDQWGYFPSVSAGWRISEEPFFRNANLSFVDNLKIRASWGKLGNESIYGAAYTGYNLYSVAYPYDFGGNVYPGGKVLELSNSATTWETTTQTNIGLDIAVFNDLSFTFDAYNKKTTDILLRVPIAPSLGSPNVPYQNAGEMTNKGFELSASYKKSLTKDLKFNVTATFAYLKNEVTSIMNDTPILHATTDNSTSVLISRVGDPFGSFYGYKMEGIFQVSDFTWQSNSDPNIPVHERTYVLKPGIPTQAENPKPGDIRFRDISGPNGEPDGVIDLDYDRTVIGNQFPDFTYSFNIGTEYKGFDINLFFHGVQGRDLYNQGAMVVPFVNDNGNVWKEGANRRWTYENPSNSHPRLFNDNTRLTMRSDYYVEDASFLRLKNVEVGYTLPRRLMKKLKMESVRVYAGVQNAFTITSFNGWDPERPATNISSDVYPQVRVYNMGINVNF